MRSFYTFCFLFLVTVSLVEGAPKVVTGPERCKSDGTTCALCVGVPKDKSGGSCAWSGELAEFGQCAFLPKAIKSTTEQSTNKEACGKLPSAKNGQSSKKLDAAIEQAWQSRRAHTLYGEKTPNVGRHVFSTWNEDNTPKPDQLKFSKTTFIGQQKDQGKSFWTDIAGSAVQGHIIENKNDIGPFVTNAFADPKFDFKDKLRKGDNLNVAKMCKTAIKFAVLKRGSPNIDEIQKNKWTTEGDGISIAVESTVRRLHLTGNPRAEHAEQAVHGQLLCVTVTGTSCYPGSIHPAVDAKKEGDLCTPVAPA